MINRFLLRIFKLTCPLMGMLLAMFIGFSDILPAANAAPAPVQLAQREVLPDPFNKVPQGSSKTDPKPYQASAIYEIIGSISKFLLGTIGAVSLVAFIWGGINLLISGGSSQRVERGKEILYWATIGVIFSLMSYGIISIILKVFIGKG